MAGLVVSVGILQVRVVLPLASLLSSCRLVQSYCVPELPAEVSVLVRYTLLAVDRYLPVMVMVLLSLLPSS